MHETRNLIFNNRIFRTKLAISFWVRFVTRGILDFAFWVRSVVLYFIKMNPERNLERNP